MLSDEITLIFPQKEHEAAAAAYLSAHLQAGEKTLHGDSGLDEAQSYEAWLEKINEALRYKITSVVYFAVRQGDKKIIGMINVRYPYEDYVRIYGHIGYGVRPEERKKGYATRMLRQALAYCKEIGLEKVLLTCDKPNAASAKTITKCGGVLESEILQPDGEWMQRYWIALGVTTPLTD